MARSRRPRQLLFGVLADTEPYRDGRKISSASCARDSIRDDSAGGTRFVNAIDFENCHHRESYDLAILRVVCARERSPKEMWTCPGSKRRWRNRLQSGKPVITVGFEVRI